MKALQWTFAWCFICGLSFPVHAQQTWKVGVPNPNDAIALLVNDTLYVSGIGEFNASSVMREEDCYRTGIRTVIIEPGITAIGNGCFAELQGVKDIKIPTTVKSIGDNAFYYSSIDTLIIPDGVETLGRSIFSFCVRLRSVTIGKDVRNIGVAELSAGFRYDAYSLNEVNISPEHPYRTSIDGVVYSKDADTLIFCPAAKASPFTIPGSVSCIGNKAFIGSVKLLIIPETVQHIGRAAFSGNEILMVLNPTPLDIEASVFGSTTNMPRLTIYVPKESVDAYKNSNWNSWYNEIHAMPESLTLSKTSWTIEEDFESRGDDVSFYISPKIPVQWSSSNSEIVSVTGAVNGSYGRLKAHAIGTAIITASAHNYISTCEVTVVPKGSLTTGIDIVEDGSSSQSLMEYNSDTHSLSLYPSADSDHEKAFTIHIVNASGKTICQIVSQHNSQVSLPPLSAGWYIATVRLATGEQGICKFTVHD